MTTTEGDPESGRPRIAGAIDGDLQTCWMCGKAVSARAFFCHACGAIQPPADIDHFMRLGLERRFDIELERLDKQRVGLSKALDPGRFAARSGRQRDYARLQAEALDAAYLVLREPGRRARYLLELEGLGEAIPEHRVPAEIEAEIAAAADMSDCDRLGARIASEVATCVTALSAAFRKGQHEDAARMLALLESLESVAATVRGRRTELPPADSVVDEGADP